MYCPHCGQQQASDEMRFCSRCGFSLRGVFYARRNEVIQGLLLMLIGIIFLPFVEGVIDGVTEYLKESGVNVPRAIFPDVVAFFFFIAGLLRIFYAVSVERIARRTFKREASTLRRSTTKPTQADVTTRTAGEPLTDGELVTPSSIHVDAAETGRLQNIAERTTKLMDKESDLGDRELHTEARVPG